MPQATNNAIAKIIQELENVQSEYHDAINKLGEIILKINSKKIGGIEITPELIIEDLMFYFNNLNNSIGTTGTTDFSPAITVETAQPKTSNDRQEIILEDLKEKIIEILTNKINIDGTIPLETLTEEINDSRINVENFKAIAAQNDIDKIITIEDEVVLLKTHLKDRIIAGRKFLLVLSILEFPEQDERIFIGIWEGDRFFTWEYTTAEKFDCWKSCYQFKSRDEYEKLISTNEQSNKQIQLLLFDSDLSMIPLNSIVEPTTQTAEIIPVNNDTSSSKTNTSTAIQDFCLQKLKAVKESSRATGIPMYGAKGLLPMVKKAFPKTRIDRSTLIDILSHVPEIYCSDTRISLH